MNNQFWARQAPRTQNPSYNSRFITNLLTKQPQQILPAKTDFTAPVKINTRATDTLLRSNSEMLRPLPALNPEQSTRGEKGSSNQGGSRMSGFGSSSLSKLQLNNDVEVYQKQRRGRQVDIISQVPRQYRDSIKVFPKIRFQNFDREFWRRKSFIEGMPSHAYNYYSDMSNKSQAAMKLSGLSTPTV